MRTLIWVLLLQAVFAEAGFAQMVYIEPRLGGQRCGMRSVSPAAPHLENRSLGTFSYGLGLRYRPRSSSRWEVGTGIWIGSAGVGYQASIPKPLLTGTSTYFSAGRSSADDVLHIPLQVSYRLVGRGTEPTEPDIASHAIHVYVTAAPQADRLQYTRDSRNGRWTSSSSSGNSVEFRRTLTDSTRWGGSLYGAVSLRYVRRNRDRITVTVYGVCGLTSLARYQLDYRLNGESHTTQLQARSTAAGVAVGIPVRIWNR